MDGALPRGRNPAALLFSAAPWVAAWYLATYLLIGTLYFAIGLAVLLTGGVLALTWVGVPLLVGALAVVRGMGALERGRARIVGWDIGPPDRRAVRGGALASLGTRLSDPASWREVLALVVLWPFQFVADLVALVLWLVFLALVSLPVWYSYPPQTFDNGTSGHGVQFGYYPDGPHGDRRYGFYIGDLHSALVVAGIGLLLLVLVGNHLVVAAARRHVTAVARLLGSDRGDGRGDGWGDDRVGRGRAGGAPVPTGRGADPPG